MHLRQIIGFFKDNIYSRIDKTLYARDKLLASLSNISTSQIGFDPL
jgi:hypothetical protein